MDRASLNLFSSPRLSSTPLLPDNSRTPLLRLSNLPTTLNFSQSLFSSPSQDDDGDDDDDDSDDNNNTIIPSTAPDPSGGGNALPSTQALALQLANLRQTDDVGRGMMSRIEAERDELRSEVVALRLQLAAEEEEGRSLESVVVELRRENADLRSPPVCPRNPPLSPPPPMTTTSTSTRSGGAPFTPVETRKKKKQRLAAEAAAAAVAAAAAAAAVSPNPTSTSTPTPTSPPPPANLFANTNAAPPPPITTSSTNINADSAPPPATTSSTNADSAPTQTIHFFHDSNHTYPTDDILTKYRQITAANNNNIRINALPTFTLTATKEVIRTKKFIPKHAPNNIRTLTFKPNDIVVICTLTNDARSTRDRQARPPKTTATHQTDIIKLLTPYLPAKNIVFLEAPPLLTESKDILPYNIITRYVALSLGARFAHTLVGEDHMWNDGFHVSFRHRHLLVKSVAAAIAGVHPQTHFKLHRPPLGPFGPWVAPIGRGMRPPPPSSYSGVAVSAPPPVQFRRRPPTRPARPTLPSRPAQIPTLMALNIQPVR